MYKTLLKITSACKTTAGNEVTNAVMDIKPHVENLSSLKVPYDIDVWNSQADYQNGLDRIVLAEINPEGTLKTRISFIDITVTEQEAATFNPSMAFQKAIDYLLAQYNLTAITITI